MAWPNQNIPQTEKQLIDLALEGKSDEFKQRVWEIVAKTDITGDDPTFLLLIALGRMEAYLDDIPDKLSRQVEQLRQLTSHAIATPTLHERYPPGTMPTRQQHPTAQEAREIYRLLLVTVGVNILLTLAVIFLAFAFLLW